MLNIIEIIEKKKIRNKIKKNFSITLLDIKAIKIIIRKNDFAEKSKILLDTDLKIILLDRQNNFIGILKIMSNAAKTFDILATSLRVLHNYFDNSKLLFRDLLLQHMTHMTIYIPKNLRKRIPKDIVKNIV